MILSTLQLATRSLAKNIIFPNGKLTTLPCLINVKDFHITLNDLREFRVGNLKVKAKSIGKNVTLDGEKTIEMFPSAESTGSVFPDASTEHKLFNNVPYNRLHVVNIKTTGNNTVMSFTDYKGLGIITHSAGIEGFKNAKKGTNIAAQQAAYTFGKRIIEKGFNTVKLRIQGIGPGRMGAIKGIQLAELNVVSITDDTRVSWNPLKPRKKRRI